MTRTPWHQTPAARRVLSRLHPANLWLFKSAPVMGDAELHIGGEAPSGGTLTEELSKLRTAHADALFGMTFLEAERQGKTDDYFAVWNAQPEVQDVLREMFGDPRRFSGFGKNTAERLWREAAVEARAQQVAA